MFRPILAIILITAAYLVSCSSPTSNVETPAQPPALENLGELPPEFTPDRPTAIPLDSFQEQTQEELRQSITEASEETAYNSTFFIEVVSENLQKETLSVQTRSYLLGLIFDNSATSEHARALIGLYLQKFGVEANLITDTLSSLLPELEIISTTSKEIEAILIQDSGTPLTSIKGFDELLLDLEAASSKILSLLPTLRTIE